MLFLECIDFVDAELTQSIRSKFPNHRGITTGTCVCLKEKGVYFKK